MPATVATELMTPALRGLEQLGAEVASAGRESGLEILAAAGMRLRSFSDLNTRIPHATAIALLENAERESRDPAFALRAAQGVQRGDFGLFDLLTGCAATLHDSMLLAARYMPLLHDGATFNVAVRAELVRWEHRVRPGLELSAAASEYVVACFLFGAYHMLGFRAPPLELCFSHEPPPYAEHYAQVLGAPARFGCECNAIVLPRAALTLPLRTADPPMLAVLTHHGDDLLQRLPITPLLVQRARSLIRDRIAQGPSLPALARALHTSESTLQRRLQAAGTSHSALIDAVRRELALELLDDGELNISEVAFKLGFAHSPAFHRAFKRWYGKSPTEHRELRTRSEFYRFHRVAAVRR